MVLRLLNLNLPFSNLNDRKIGSKSRGNIIVQKKINGWSLQKYSQHQFIDWKNIIEVITMLKYLSVTKSKSFYV